MPAQRRQRSSSILDAAIPGSTSCKRFELSETVERFERLEPDSSAYRLVPIG